MYTVVPKTCSLIKGVSEVNFNGFKYIRALNTSMATVHFQEWVEYACKITWLQIFVSGKHHIGLYCGRKHWGKGFMILGFSFPRIELRSCYLFILFPSSPGLQFQSWSKVINLPLKELCELWVLQLLTWSSSGHTAQSTSSPSYPLFPTPTCTQMWTQTILQMWRLLTPLSPLNQLSQQDTQHNWLRWMTVTDIPYSCI